MAVNNFWQLKSLEQMTAAEWEALCDGCGRCCLLKLEYEDSGEIEHTAVSCRLLDIESCRCRDYTRRLEKVPECLRIRPDNIAGLRWLPSTCAYKRLSQGLALPDWHYLVCGDRNAVHEAGVSVKYFAVSEDYVHPEQLADFVIDEDNE